MKRKHIYVLIVACIILVLAYAGIKFQKPSSGESELSQKLNAFVEEALQKELFPGAVLLVAEKGVILHRRAYGHARRYDYGPVELPRPEAMSPDHLFDVASLTKVFATTFGIMLLVDRGEIALDDFVHTYLDGFAAGEKRNIRIRHLLRHRAGLASWKPVYYHAANREESLAYISTLPLRYPVGSVRHYSDLGFMILGYLIEEITGTSLDRYLAENLYEPLGLARTTFNPLDRGYKKLVATSHGNPFERRTVADDSFEDRCDEDPGAFQKWRRYTLRGEVNDGNAFYAHGGVAGHAGLFSTVDDLKILTDLLINGGSLGKQAYIRPETVAAFLQSGLGWSRNPRFIRAEGAPEGTFGHTGFTGCNVVVMPQTKIVIILLTNRQHAGVGTGGYYPAIDQLRRTIVTTVLEGIDLLHSSPLTCR